MKKLIPFMVLALVLLFGCAKEETTTSALSINDQQEEESSFGWSVNYEGENLVWEAIPIDQLQSNLGSGATNRSNGNSAHTHGNYSGFSGNLAITFNGTENNGGPHGSAEFEQTFNLPFPPFIATVVMSMETESVVVEGNEAIYGGLITESEGSPFPGGGPFAVGNYFYFKVIDNGQGNNAPTDQFYGAQFGLGTPAANGGAGLPWGITVFDVEGENDKIKVN